VSEHYNSLETTRRPDQGVASGDKVVCSCRKKEGRETKRIRRTTQEREKTKKARKIKVGIDEEKVDRRERK
jgi:hypothetical protein